ncbi:hypothetical protein Cgig2_025978 [Carnegiea gigantea]|uniref:DUF4283 domain-containing protein n=1 Tax=Carnegiea gigantea TaxID=171969 RepID=A0A9Q1JK65_9CARY|nr:hypothetical protein Cgig2_025978 [Carnegiea gigantea]
MQGFLKRIWAAYEPDKIIHVRKGVFLVRFLNIQDKQEGWNPDMDLHTEAIKSLPLWIRLPDLDLKYWGMESLSKIGSLIGIPLKTDCYTKERTMIKYARLMIEVPIEGPFPDFVEFFNDEDILIRQQVQFEWKPIKCTHCSMYGHTEEICKKKVGQRMEWRPVQSKQQPHAINEPVRGQPSKDKNPEEVHNDNYFTPVTRKSISKPNSPSSYCI